MQNTYQISHAKVKTSKKCMTHTFFKQSSDFILRVSNIHTNTLMYSVLQMDNSGVS